MTQQFARIAHSFAASVRRARAIRLAAEK